MSEATGKVIRRKRNAFVCNYDCGCHHKNGEKGTSIESRNVNKNKEDKLYWLDCITQEQETYYQGKDWWIRLQWHEEHH